MAIQDKFNKPNVIYKITKDIDLEGGTLTIPSGCTLDFQGGSFSNGNIVGNVKIKGNTVNIFDSTVKLFEVNSDDVEVLSTTLCKVKASNSIISLSERKILAIDSEVSPLNIAYITPNSTPISEYNKEGKLVYNTNTILITDNTGVIATTYDSTKSYNVWDIVTPKYNNVLVLDKVSPDMFKVSGYENKVISAVNIAQILNISVHIENSYDISKPLIISRNCTIDFDNNQLTYSGNTILSASIIICPINTQVTYGFMTIKNVKISGSNIDSAILILGLSRSIIDNVFGLSCKKVINLNAITAIVYNKITGIKAYSVDYGIYSIPYFENYNTGTSYINGNLYQFNNVGNCNINAGYFCYGNGNTIVGGDSETLGKEYCFVFNGERATLRDIMWLETGRTIKAINESMITITGDIYNNAPINCSSDSIVTFGENHYTGYYTNQISTQPKDLFNIGRVLDSYIRLGMFYPKIFGYDLHTNKWIDTNMTNSNYGMGRENIASNYGFMKIPIDSIENKTVIFTINNHGIFSTYNYTDTIGICKGTNMVAPGLDNDSKMLCKITYKNFSQYNYELPILTVAPNYPNIGTEQKGVIKAMLYFYLDDSGNLVVNWNKNGDSSVVCTAANYNSAVGDIYLYINSPQNTFSIQDIAVFNRKLTIKEFYNYGKLLDSFVVTLPTSGQGTTAQRPILFSNLEGYLYYDTTLKKPIWWNGTTWVDATGATV